MDKLPYMNAEDFLKGAEPSEPYERFLEALRNENAGKLLDAVQIRRGQDWSAVSHQVFGGEVRLAKPAF